MTETAPPIKLPETHCPACGVGVVAGSSRCPRCHSALPVASLEGRSLSPWLLIVLSLAATGAIVFALLGSSGSDDPSPRSPEPAARAVAPASGPGAAAAPVPGGPATPEAALDALVRSAENRNLEATFEVRSGAPDHVTVVSEQCGDDRLRRLLSERSVALGEAGFAALSCVSADGREHLSLSFR